MHTPSTLSFGEWTLHRDSGELEREGKRVRLQDLPFQILDELLQHPGEVVTREQLIARLWPKVVVDYDANLNSGVRRLRAALHDDAEAPRYIETVPRKGYRYIGITPGVGAVTEAPASLNKRPRRWVWASVSVAAIAAAAVAIAVWVLSERHSQPSDSNFAAANTDTRLRLAVLPFVNLSPDPANAFFADGLHEEILSSIADRVPHLEVISRTTMMAYRAAPKSVHDMARELNVSHVLEGSVRREGQTIRLTLQLIDARSDAHLWSKNFDRPLLDTMRLQSEVAREVSSQLAVKLSGDIAELPAPASTEAFDLYLKARVALQTVAARRSRQAQTTAEELLNRAIDIDPAFAAAFLERARVRMSRFVSSQDVSENNLRALRADLSVARKLMGDAPPLLVSEADYALLADFDAAKAVQLLRTAQALNPHGSEVLHALARHLGSTGKLDESLVCFEQAAQLDPGNPDVLSDRAAALKMNRQAQESLRISRDFDSRYPGLITYGWRLFGFTAQLDRVQAEMAQLDQTADAESRLAAQFDLLLFSRRFVDLEPLLQLPGFTTLPQTNTGGGFSIPAIGRKPVAELRGWSGLLAGNGGNAARDGRLVLDFVAHEPVTKWNGWYLRLLAAEGALFSGDKAKAAADTRRALAMAPRDIHPGIQRYARAQAARVLAWAGADDDAVALLEQLSSEFPMIGPAEVTRDPLYAMPLAGNARYRALEQRLEAEIAANQKF